MAGNRMVTQELPAAQLVGKRYLLRNLLGEGAMGTVYEASDLLTQQTVAVKRVTLRQTEDGTPVDDWSAVRMTLTQEFETLASLKHPHIVDVLNYGFDADGQPYFVMARVHGRQDIITAAQAADIPQQAQMIVQLLQALDYLHRRNLVHRDIKPPNVLLNNEQQIKLVDFGLAVEIGHQMEIGGTLGYMAPETLLRSEVNKASDLYAVGMIAYQIFTGKYPFQIEDNPELLAELVHTLPDVSALPEPLGMVLSKLLAKNPTERYQLAAEVMRDLCGALDVPVPTETIAVRESYLKAARFVGRTVELAQLSGALSSVIDGRGSSWLIGGMSGIGKSRLLDELRTFGLVWGVQTLRGGASPAGEMPYECLRAPLRQLALATELSDVEAGVLQQIVPDLADVLSRRISPMPRLSSAAEQQRLFWTVQAIFKRQTEPVLLILEDLQWGEGSIELLKGLIDLTQDRPIMIVASYRNDERPDLAETLPAMRHLGLERLTADEIVELSEAILGEPGRNPQVLALLERETEGNVFFMIETLRALADQAGDLAAVAAMDLPERIFPAGIQAIVERRLTALPLDFHPLLRIAAVAGRQIDGRILQHIDPVIKLDYWLNACAELQILAFRDQHWWFAHDKLRDGILHGLDPVYVVGLHRMVAEAIESIYHYQLEDRARELMYHWQAAGDTTKELHYTISAAEQAERVGLFGDALRFLERAQTLLPPDDSPQHLSVLTNLGEIYWQTGQHDQALATLHAAHTLARTWGDPEHQIRVLFWLGYVLAHHFRAATNDLQQSYAYFQQALSIAEHIDHRRGIIAIYYGIGLNQFSQGHTDAARAAYLQSIATARNNNEPSIFACYALNDMGAICVNQGELVQAKRYFEQCCKQTQQVGSLDYVSACGNLGEIARLQGDLTAAYTYYEDALQLAKQTGKHLVVPVQYLNMALIDLMQRKPTKALAHLAQAVQHNQANPNEMTVVSCILTMAGIYALEEEFDTALPWFGYAISRVELHQWGGDDADVVRTILREELTEDAIERGMAQGQTLDPDTLWAELIAEIDALEAGEAGTSQG